MQTTHTTTGSLILCKAWESNHSASSLALDGFACCRAFAVNNHESVSARWHWGFGRGLPSSMLRIMSMLALQSQLWLQVFRAYYSSAPVHVKFLASCGRFDRLRLHILHG